MIHKRKEALVLVALAALTWTFVPRATGQAGSANPKQQTNLFGSSGGNANDSSGRECCSGTLGSLLLLGGKNYILSNNHVLGLMQHAQKGDPISQPGLVDTQCSPRRIVASFTFAPPLADNMDAAIAEVMDSTMDPKGTIIGIGIPAGNSVDPKPQMPIQKSGRSTGVTHSTIQSFPTNVKVDYSHACRFGIADPVSFTDQIVIATDAAHAFAASGDSGALLMTEEKEPVGLIFSGSSTLVAATPIQEVVDRLSKEVGVNQTFRSSPTNVAAAISELRMGEANQSVAARSLVPQFAKAISAKNHIFEHFLSEPSVIGVGVGGSVDEPEMVVYVQKQPLPALLEKAEIVKAEVDYRFHGIKTTIVKTEPIKAFGWGETRTNEQACSIR